MMTLKEAMNKAAKTYKGGIRGVGRALGKEARSLSVFANKFVEGQPHHPTADDVVGVVRVTGDPLPLQTLAYQCGYVVAPMPRVEYPADTDLVEAIADLQEDFAETMQEIASAMRSGSINTKHAKTVMREGLEDLQKLSLIVGHIYMMAEDREEHPAMAKQWEQVAMVPVSS